jgi:hypothetical protein
MAAKTDDVTNRVYAVRNYFANDTHTTRMICAPSETTYAAFVTPSTAQCWASWARWPAAGIATRAPFTFPQHSGQSGHLSPASLAGSLPTFRPSPGTSKTQRQTAPMLSLVASSFLVSSADVFVLNSTAATPRSASPPSCPKGSPKKHTPSRLAAVSPAPSARVTSFARRPTCRNPEMVAAPWDSLKLGRALAIAASARSPRLIAVVAPIGRRNVPPRTVAVTSFAARSLQP